MKQELNKILKDIDFSIFYNNKKCDKLPYIQISELIIDSRKAHKDSLFVAIVGSQNDGHNYIKQICEKECKIAIVEKIQAIENIYQIIVDDSSSVLAKISSNFYDNPSEKLILVGITGTNGKTTTATLAYNCFIKMGYKSGLLSTIVNKINDKEIESTHTTPNPIELNKLLNLMVENNCTHCFMEVSSHALDQKRVKYLNFNIAVFTNITHDHLDYHKTFDEYLKVKKSFFDSLSNNSFALTNVDDRNGLIMLQNTKAKTFTYSLKSNSDYKVKIIENNLNGLELELNKHLITTQLTGEFNAYNILAVYAIADILGINQIEILKAISFQKPVKGRFQSFQSKTNITAIVDYAHTPDALKNVLKTIHQIKQSAKNTSRVITVIGCGGDRDKSKRPIMANISCQNSDLSIFTSDNPRSEDPNIIIDEMKAGINSNDMNKVLEIVDRNQAIKTACVMAKSNDIILIAGKGHETYQESMGVKTNFDDYKIVVDALNKLNK